MKWYCSSSLCFNNFRTKDKQGNPLNYYRLPRYPKLQVSYGKIFKTIGMNWKKGHICCAHWSKGFRTDTSDLPDIPVPPDQLQKLKQKFIRAKHGHENCKDTTLKIKKKCIYKDAAKKYKTATLMMSTTPVKKTVRRKLKIHSTPVPKKERSLSKDQYKKKLEISSNKIGCLEEQNSFCTESLEAKDKTIMDLHFKLKEKNELIKDLELKNMQLSGALENLRAKEFKYQYLRRRAVTLRYLSGISVKQFEMVFECVMPYLHLIPYPNCPNTVKSLLTMRHNFCVLTICRHGLDLSFMAFVLEKSVTTVHRIFTGWIIFLATLFQKLDIQPDSGFLLQKMPEIFVKTGHGLTDIIIDATEFKFQLASNF